jgi:hypothetical protein
LRRRFAIVALTSFLVLGGLASATRREEIQYPCFGVRTGAYVPDCSCGFAALAFTGLLPEYGHLGEVIAAARNVGQAKLFIDPIQAGVPVIFRWNPELVTWDEVETWRCANAGLGTKRLVEAGGVLPLKATNASAVFSLDRGEVVELFDGSIVAVPGWYRIGLRYAHEYWPVLDPGPRPSCELQLSDSFLVKE